MDRKYILFAEDEDAQRLLFKDAVNDWNSENSEREFCVIYAKTVEEASILLKRQRFDCALFDLKLPAAPGDPRKEADGGNSLAREGIFGHGIPVAIISGNPGDLDPDIADLHLVKAIFKGPGDPYAEAVNWFAALWDMMNVLDTVRTRLSAAGADVFARRIWPRWQNFNELRQQIGNELDDVVTRQYAAHIADQMGLEQDGNVRWHPSECYIDPALQEDRANTGDIFEIDGELLVVLTPQCDMATQTARTVILAKCVSDGLPEWSERVAEFAQDGLSPRKIESRDKFFLRLINQNIEPSRHFLPPLRGGNPLLVDFKDVRTVPMEQLNATLTLRVASVAQSFLPNLTQRFGAYISRTGQPNIEIRHFQHA